MSNLEKSTDQKTLTVVRALKNKDKKDMTTRKYFILMPTQNGEMKPIACETYTTYAEQLKDKGLTHIRLIDIDGVFIVDVNTLTVQSIANN